MRLSVLALLLFLEVDCFTPGTLVINARNQRQNCRIVIANSQASLNRVTPSTQSDDKGESPGLGAWVPVGSISSLKGLDPTCIEIMGRQYAVWQNEQTQTWSVLTDECPHRLAPLSQGRVDRASGCLECPYHGWQFDTHGTLTRLPQLDEGRSLPTSQAVHAQSFPVHITGDLLWTFLPTWMHGESFPQDLLPEDYYTHLDEFTTNTDQPAPFYVRELPYSWDFLAENVVDGPAHFPFAHHSVGSQRTDARPVPMTVRLSNFTHFEYSSRYIRHQQSRERRHGLQRPFLLHQETQRGNNREWKRTLWFFAVPIREGHVRLLTNLRHLAHTRWNRQRPREWQVHLFNTRFFDTDIWMHQAELAARQTADSPAVPAYVYPVSSDIPVRAYRQWWHRQYGGANATQLPPPHTFGAANPANLRPLTRREQVDPWRSHTRHCSICRRVLRNAKLVEKLSVGLGMVGALWTVRSHRIVASLLLLASFWVRRRARSYVVALEGEPFPSQVGDRSVAAMD